MKIEIVPTNYRIRITLIQVLGHFTYGKTIKSRFKFVFFVAAILWAIIQRWFKMGLPDSYNFIISTLLFFPFFLPFPLSSFFSDCFCPSQTLFDLERALLNFIEQKKTRSTDHLIKQKPNKNMHHLLPPSRSLSSGTSRSSSSQNQFHFRPSNKCLLIVAAVSFLLFVVAEMFGALRSNSLSLLGDAIAMSVDVFSYITNLVAENTKDYSGRIGNPRSEYQRIVTEIAIPSFSVLCLLGVTFYITYDAINVLRHPPLVDDVPLVYLYGFAFLNLVIDVLCATLFVFRGRDVFEEPRMIMPAHVPTIRQASSSRMQSYYNLFVSLLYRHMLT